MIRKTGTIIGGRGYDATKHVNKLPEDNNCSFREPSDDLNPDTFYDTHDNFRLNL